jgi:hypothetical protein
MTDPPLSDRLDSREDIPDLRDEIKGMAREARQQGDDATVEDFLALSSNNDCTYVQPSDLERAEWFVDIYEQEGKPETHPRGFHYRIAGKGYHLRDGTEYQNTVNCWNELKKAIYWAQILGLVNPEQIRDSKNDTVTPTAFDSPERPEPPDERHYDPGDVSPQPQTRYRNARLALELSPARVEAEDATELVRGYIQQILSAAFRDVEYRDLPRQDYYIELWAEKSNVLDEDLAEEYGATLRPADGGEFSLGMVREALRIAEAREQDLVVAVVSDWDAKGVDMPRSAARKIELEAAFRDVEAFVHHATLTAEQVIEYDLPGTPAKDPSGLENRNPGALAYEGQKRTFDDYAGEFDPVEVNAFEAQYPDAYRDELRDVLDPYYDHELRDRLEDAVADAHEQAAALLQDAFADHEDDIQAALDALDSGLDKYETRLEHDFGEARRALEDLRRQEKLVRQELKIDAKREELRGALQAVEEDEVLGEVAVDPPTPAVEGGEDPLLDTRRGFREQLRRYKRFDIRYSE